MTDVHAGFEDWDAAYVLGALSAEDRRAFEDHLHGCERCRSAVSELAAMPGLLARAEPLVRPAERLDDPDGAEADGDHAAPVTVATGPRADMVEAIIRRETRRRRSVRTRIAVAAVGAAAAIGLALALPPLLSRGPEPAATVALAPVAPTALTASVAFEPVPWGTRLEVTCSYPGEGDDYSAPGSYVLVITDDAGASSEVATWNAVPGRDITLAAATALPLDAIASVAITTGSGGAVLAGDLEG